MNQQSHGQHKAGHQHPGQANPGQLDPGHEPNAGESSRPAAGRLAAKRNEAVLGPFTARDVTVFASTLLLFVASLIPMFGAVYNLWNLGNLFFLGLGIVLPLIVVALFVARRLAPGTKVRIGSLSVDQFASVVASFALAFFFLSAAGAFTPIMLVALIGSLVLFAATVPARFIPVFAGDFLDRAEVPAHVVARESAVPFRKPSAPKAAKAPKTAKTPKESGAGPLAGWAKRMTAGGAAAGATAVSTAPAAAASPAGDAEGQSSPAPTPVHTQGQSAGQPSRPAAAASPATQASPVVPSVAEQTHAATATHASPVVPSAAEQTHAATATQASPVVPSAAGQTHAGDVPVRQSAQAGAASVPSAATIPGASSGASTADAAPAPTPVQAPAQTMLHPQVKSQEPIGATVDPSSRPAAHEEPVHEAFWFAVAQPRTAVDERTGMPAFVIEPGGWVLALEDRGHEFLVQHTDGRVGVLRDLSNIERG